MADELSESSQLLGGQVSMADPNIQHGTPPSSVTSQSSIFQRRKEAATGGIGKYNSFGGAVNDILPAKKDKGLGIRDHKRETHSTTDLQTFAHLLKGNVGTGLLALPEAVKNAGLIIGVVGLLVMGIITTHCMLILVKTAQELCHRRQYSALNYAEVSRLAVAEHTSITLISQVAGYIINVFLMITQFGFCCVYLVFIGENVQQVACSGFGITWKVEVWIAIAVIPVMVLTWIRNLDELAIVSTLANLAIIFSLAVIVYEVLYKLTTDNPDEKAAIRNGDVEYFAYKKMALYFGAAIYAFEGIGVVLPLENKMKQPAHSKRVVVLAMLVTAFMYAGFGGLGYITYGSVIRGSITLNLKSTRIASCSLFLIVKLYYSFAIVATYALQFYVPMDFLEPPILDKLAHWFPRHHNKLRTLTQLTFRSFIVLVTGALALAIPDLDDLISLVGAFASSSLALIFPPLLEILVFWNSSGHKFCGLRVPRPVWVTKDILIMTLGIVGFAFGTFSSIQQIVENYDKRSNDTIQYCGLGHCN